jgi:hypothetical protein
MAVSSEITVRIQHLLEAREQHAQAITSIDATLARVGAALGGTLKAAPAVKKAAAPAKAAPAKAAPAAVAPKAAPAAPATRKPGKFAVSGEASILAFIKSKGSPVGREIESKWKSEGRKGRAINAVSKLVRDKKLKRTPLKGERGSRYSLA